VGDCLVWVQLGDGTPSSLSATIVSSTQIDVSATGVTGLVVPIISITVDDETDLSIPWTVATTVFGVPSYNSFDILLYVTRCSDNAIVASDSDSYAEQTSGSGTFSVTGLPAGTYTVVIQFIGFGTPTTTAEYSVVSSTSLVANPVIALWDDSGTTRQLWACPKLFLPPLTEDTGDWYADCAAADDVLTDALQVSNCVGFCESSPAPSSFTATDGGTSLTLDQAFASAPGLGALMWGGVNLEAGETVTASYTSNGITLGPPFDPDYATGLEMKIYDDAGTLVWSGNTYDGSTPSPLVSSAVPYTGRYTISVQLACLTVFGACFTTCSAVITSSGTMSVNQIAARYDLGLDCSGLLNCGDSC
jgi:hypothetical protein